MKREKETGSKRNEEKMRYLINKNYIFWERVKERSWKTEGKRKKNKEQVEKIRNIE